MSISHAPNIVTNGLVLYYDMFNKNKSFVGTPTTNILSMSDWNNNMANVWSGQFWTTVTRSFETTNLLYSGINVVKGVVQGTVSGGVSYCDVNLPTGTTAGIVYACSVWYKSNSRNGRVWSHDVTGLNSTGDAVGLTPDNQWHRAVNIFTSTTSGKVRMHLGFYEGLVGDVVYFTAPQIEQLSYASPFVNGTRSNTQSVKDLTGNSTITATSLTYASDQTFSFNGSSNYLTVADANILSFPDQKFTFDFWVYFNNTTTPPGIVGKGQGNWEYAIYSGSGGSLNFYAWTIPGSAVYLNTTTYAANTWYHFSWSADGTNSRLYTNGQLTGTVARSAGAAMGNGPQPVTIGAGGDSGGLRYLNGKLSNFKIYNRALTEYEIKQNFNATKGLYGL